MKTNVKRLAALAVAGVLAVGATGCQNKAEKAESGEVKTLTLYMYNDDCPEKNMVAEEVSKITREKIGVNIEMKMYSPVEYYEKIPLLLASKEKMDIGFDAGEGYVERARKKAYVDISEYLKGKNSKLYDTVPETLWNGVTIDGGIYGVPTYKEFAEVRALYGEKEFMDNNGIDPASITKLADGEKLLEALKKDPNRCGFIISPRSNSQTAIAMDAEFDKIIDHFVVSKEEGKTVTHYALTDEFKDFVYMMRDWYNKGYIAKDVLTRDNYNEYMTDGNHYYGMGTVIYAPGAEVSKARNYGKEFYPMMVTPPTITNASTRGSIYSVYRDCCDIDAAMDFLELWNTDSQVKNLITYGIEGRHYNLVDGQVDYVPDYQKMYWVQNWVSGNTTISYTMLGESKDKNEEYKEFNSKAVEAVTYGFNPDTAAFSELLAACRSVVSEYVGVMACGAVEPDEYLPQLEKRLKESGVDTVIEQLQKQFDEWQKTK